MLKNSEILMRVILQLHFSNICYLRNVIEVTLKIIVKLICEMSANKRYPFFFAKVNTGPEPDSTGARQGKATPTSA